MANEILLQTEDEVEMMFLNPEFLAGLERQLIPIITESDSPRSFAA